MQTPILILEMNIYLSAILMTGRVCVLYLFENEYQAFIQKYFGYKQSKYSLMYVPSVALLGAIVK